jgi:hypothetical protein
VPPEPIINTLSRIAGERGVPVRIRAGAFGPTGWSVEYPLIGTWRTEFAAEHVPEDLVLVVDRDGLAGEARVLLNGTELALADGGTEFVFEHSNVGWPVADLVEAGRNELCIEITVDADDEGLLEAAWLMGSFGVAGRPGARTLVAPPERVQPLDLPSSGLPHFSGTLALERKLDLDADTTQLTLDAGESRFLDCAELFIDGRSLGVRCWAPWRWEAPADMAAAEVTVRLEITTSAGPAIEGRVFDMDAGEYVEL